MRLTVESVLHPVGVLPHRVYWKRRLAGLGVVLLLVLVPVVLLTGGGGEAAGGGTVSPGAAATDAEAPQLDLVPAESLSPTTTPPAAGAPTTAVPSGGSGSPTSAAPPTAAPPPACTDATVAVTAGSTQPQWRTDAKPVFTMTVTNAGTTACRRDVGTGQQEWGLFDGDTRLWGSNDCLSEPGQNVLTLQPGQQVTVQVTWSGLTSEPTCQQPRERLAGGEYQLRARIGPVQSANFAVVLR